MLASSKHKYSKTLAFPDTYYELIINVLQSVELFCAYKRRENSGLPRVWIADLVCARHSLDRDLSHNSRNKMRAHITCRMGRYRSAPLVTKGYIIYY